MVKTLFVKPFMLKKVDGIRSFRRFFLKSLLDKIFSFDWDLVPNLMVEWKLMLKYTLENLMLWFTSKGRTTRKKNIDNDTDAPYIYLLIIWHLFDDLWCHVERTPKSLAHSFLRIIKTSKPKICDFYIQVHIIIFFQENIFWFNISNKIKF